MLDVILDPGNIHDSVAFDGLYDRLCGKFPEMKHIVADAGYKTPRIAKRVIDDDRIPVLPYRRPMGKDGFFRPHEFVYDEYFDCILCPENNVLKYTATTREGCRQFKSDPNTNSQSTYRHLCGWVRLKFAAMNLKKYAIHKWHFCDRFAYSLFFLLFPVAV